jgi:branched-chain amino acid transport system permease protein
MVELPSKKVLAGLGILVAVIYPFALTVSGAYTYYLQAGFLILMWIGLASAWNIIGGFTGYVSFGHVAFFGFGMFTAAVLSQGYGIGTSIASVGGIAQFLFVLLMGGLVSAFIAAAIAYPVLRLRGHYFAIAMLGIAEAANAIFINVNWLKGSKGWTMPILSPPAISQTQFLYFAMLVVAVLTVAAAYLIKNTKPGYGLVAIREGEDAAKMLGLPVTRYKIFGFVASAFFPGVIGAIYAYKLSFVVATQGFYVGKTIEMIVITLIGGLGTVAGPIIGGVVFVGLKQVVLSNFMDWHLFATGLVIVVMVLGAPRGVVGLWNDYRETGEMPIDVRSLVGNTIGGSEAKTAEVSQDE